MTRRDIFYYEYPFTFLTEISLCPMLSFMVIRLSLIVFLLHNDH